MFTTVYSNYQSLTPVFITYEFDFFLWIARNKQTNVRIYTSFTGLSKSRATSYRNLSESYTTFKPKNLSIIEIGCNAIQETSKHCFL